MSSATTVAEARKLEESGVDAIIAQGIEAGGHRATFTGIDVGMQPGLFALLPQIVDAVQVPVIAAGGVADGRTAAAAFVLGASAVQLGTAFLRCAEAEVRDAHRAALATADDAATVVTNVISGRACRYIRNSMIDELVASGLQPLPIPAQQSLTSALAAAGDREWTALTAGQSAALAKDTDAAELVHRLAEETTRRLRAFCVNVSPPGGAQSSLWCRLFRMDAVLAAGHAGGMARVGLEPHEWPTMTDGKAATSCLGLARARYKCGISSQAPRRIRLIGSTGRNASHLLRRKTQW